MTLIHRVGALLSAPVNATGVSVGTNGTPKATVLNKYCGYTLHGPHIQYESICPQRLLGVSSIFLQKAFMSQTLHDFWWFQLWYFAHQHFCLLDSEWFAQAGDADADYLVDTECSAPPGCTAGIGDSSCRAIFLWDQVVPGGPLPVINGVTTPIGRILSPLTQLFSAIYRGPMSLHL